MTSYPEKPNIQEISRKWQKLMLIDYVNNRQPNRASDPVYVHIENVFLAILKGQIFKEFLANGKN